MRQLDPSDQYDLDRLTQLRDYYTQQGQFEYAASIQAEIDEIFKNA